MTTPTNEEMDRVITELAIEDGIDAVLDIPGVWDCLIRYYNNAARRRIAGDRIADVCVGEDFDPDTGMNGWRENYIDRAITTTERYASDCDDDPLEDYEDLFEDTWND